MPKLNQIQLRDPFVVCEDGTYYLFGSTDPDIWRAPGIGFDVYRGVGQFHDFEGPFPAFRPPREFWSEKNFWAPEVRRHNGSYFMFATFKPVSGCRGTAVLRSDTIMGPYLPWSQGVVTPHDWECLDGTLYVDRGRQAWMVFCHEWSQIGDGQICALPLTDDLSAAAGEPFTLFSASQAEWAAPLRGRAPGSYVTDGPYVVRREDELFLLWSSFGEAGNYCIGVARSDSGELAGPWIQSARALFEADGGHGMVFRDLAGGLHLAIHTPNSTPDERPIFVGLLETAQGFALSGEILS